MTVTAPASHNRAETQVVEAAGIEFAYRRFGRPAGMPLVMLQHFRGNLDNWDPELVDALARERRVVTFDNAGVAGSTGTTPSATAATALAAASPSSSRRAGPRWVRASSSEATTSISG